MNTLHQSFESRLIEQSSTIINKEANSYYDTFLKTQAWKNKLVDLDFQYRQYTEYSSTKKLSWMFFLWVIFPITCMLDYASISSFLQFIAASAPSFLKLIISCISWLFFACLEIACGLLIVNSKDKPLMRIAGVILACVLALTPSLIVYNTYLITPHKTEQLYTKTISLIVISITLHLIFFLCIKQIIFGLFLMIYLIKRRFLVAKNPQAKMEIIKEKIQEQYTVFSRYAKVQTSTEYVHLLSNLAWYIIRQKIISPRNAYDLSDFSFDANYAPIQSNTNSKLQ